MASFFGEVVESFSRAYDGNCEDISQPDELVDSISYETNWKVRERPNEVDLLIVLDGKCARGISDTLRCHGTLVAEISESKRKGDDDPPRRAPESSSFMYRLSNGFYVCEVSPDVKLVNANLFVDKLHVFIRNAFEVLIIASRTSLGYFSTKCEVAPFIRGLCNSTYLAGGGRLFSSPIDTCNMVTGVAASVFMCSSWLQKRASVYVMYTPMDKMDSTTWSLSVDLLSNWWSLKDILSKASFKEKDTVNRTGNLYM